MIQNMAEELTGQVNAEEYWRLGGKLNRDGLKKAKRVLSALTKGGNPDRWRILLCYRHRTWLTSVN